MRKVKCKSNDTEYVLLSNPNELMGKLILHVKYHDERLLMIVSGDPTEKPIKNIIDLQIVTRGDLNIFQSMMDLDAWTEEALGLCTALEIKEAADQKDKEYRQRMRKQRREQWERLRKEFEPDATTN